MTVSGGTQPNDVVTALTPDDEDFYEISDSDASVITFYGASDGIIKVIESVTGSFVIYEEYKRNFQSTVTLQPGVYTFECWGGQGISVYDTNYATTISGGMGGYSKGTATFNETVTLYIYVPKSAETKFISDVVTADLNGNNACGVFASSVSRENCYICAGGGGGASCHFRKTSTTATIQQPTSDASLRAGGYGGGTSGGATNPNTSSTTRPGTQSSGGNGTSLSGRSGRIGGPTTGLYYMVGDGGWGYYGGGKGETTDYKSSFAPVYGASGGSGYVNTTILSDTIIYDGSQTFLSPEGIEEVGHHGSACIRIRGVTPPEYTRTYEIFSAQSRDDINTPYTVDLNPDFIGDSTFTRKVHVNETINESTRRLQNLTNMCSHKPNSNVLSYINQAQQCNYKFTTGKHYLDSNIDKYGDVYFKDSGNWITSKKGTYIKRNGDWAKSKSVYVKENGFWKTMMPNSVTINFSLDGETIEPIVSYMGCTIIPPNNGGAITWRDDDDNDVTNGYRIYSAVDSITLYGSVER